MFEKLLKSAFDGGGEVFVYIKGFHSPLRGRVQDLEGDCFTLFQNGKMGTVLWAFRLPDLLSCGLLVGPPTGETTLLNEAVEATSQEAPFNELDN